MNTRFKNFFLIDHPLVKKDITVLRDVSTNCETFRAALTRISNILAVEISKEFSFSEIDVQTPLEKTSGVKIEQDIVLVPVLRAGLGMVDGFVQIIPDAKVGHIGLERDEETLKPTTYYHNTPENIDKSEVVLLDPMLATGGSSSAAINFLKQQGARDFAFACILAAPEGVSKLASDHPDVKIFGAALDRELNEKGYILPGLGDAGDRTFGTL
jgi:uracil phosphoribosyltransferase